MGYRDKNKALKYARLRKVLEQEPHLRNQDLAARFGIGPSTIGELRKKFGIAPTPSGNGLLTGKEMRAMKLPQALNAWHRRKKDKK